MNLPIKIKFFLTTKILIIFGLIFFPFPHMLFAKKEPSLTYKIIEPSNTSPFYLYGDKNKLNFDHILTSYQDKHNNLQIHLDKKFSNVLMLKETYQQPDTKKISDKKKIFLVQGAIENFDTALHKYITFIYQDLHTKRSHLLGFYSFFPERQGALSYLRFKNEVIYYKPYSCAILTIPEKDKKHFALIMYFKENDLGDFPYHKEYHFIDVNNDNIIDFIELKASYTNFIVSINLYQGPYYIQKLTKHYKTYLQKIKYKHIDSKEIGVFEFSGKRDEIKLLPNKNKDIAFLFEMGTRLMPFYEQLDTTFLSSFDRRLREVISSLNYATIQKLSHEHLKDQA